MSSEELREGQMLAGKYRVEHVLGSGGMGVVLAATHVELDQRVAIKVLRKTFAESETVAERFRREARAACKIKSPHGARVLDVGTTEDGLPYMVMEYLDGHDLAEELVRRGRLPIDEATSYVLQAADAICDAHDESIIHRDLKPANLFLTERAGVHAVKVLDFGISKSLEDTSPANAALTHTHALIGSPMYMSPEQLDSPRTVDARTDIWSLGIVLYELVTGGPPFLADGIAGLIKQIVAEDPPSLASLGVDAPPEFEAIVLRCLAKRREQRYSSVRELMDALAPFAKVSAFSVQTSTRPAHGGAPPRESKSREPKLRDPSGGSVKAGSAIKVAHTRVAGRSVDIPIDVVAEHAETPKGSGATSEPSATQFEQSSTKNSDRPRKGGAWPWMVGAVAAAAAGIGAILYMGEGSDGPALEPTRGVAAITQLPTTMAADPSPVFSGATSPVTVAGPATKSELDPTQKPATDKPATDDTSDPPEVQVEPTPTEVSPARPSPRPKKRAATPAADSAGREPKPASDVSDFGGRN